MKKQTLLVLAGGLLTFAACTNDNQSGGYTQEQVDSIVDARVAEMQIQMQMSNDSAINALAQWKADSMIAAAKGQAAPSRPKPVVKGTSSGGGGGTTTHTTPSEPSTPVKQKGDVTDRKSGSDATKNTDVTDRKSSQDKQQNADVTDRKSKQK